MRLPREVYVIRNLITGKVYVGSSYNIKGRLRRHLVALRGGKHSVEDMQKDYNEYGELFLISVVDKINTYNEKYKEYEWMKRLNSYKREVGYNYKDKYSFNKDREVTCLLKQIN